jgi:hypothetical protein
MRLRNAILPRITVSSLPREGSTREEYHAKLVVGNEAV